MTNASEAKIARMIDADVVKNSGRGRKKGDMILKGTMLIDAKEGKSFTLNEANWAKVCTDSYKNGQVYEPMILRVMPNGQKIAIIDYSFFEQLLNCYLEGHVNVE